LPNHESEIDELADHIRDRRDAILQSWRTGVESDPALTAASTLTRAQFNDHIPEVLDNFERSLRAKTPRQEDSARLDQQQSAADHGTHRWQQGYDQRQVMREWLHLQLCLLGELEYYAQGHRDLDASTMRTARIIVAELCGEGVAESASRYARLQQSDAAGQLRDLEHALQQLDELERQRVRFWREAAHDLRGNLNVVASATAMLNKNPIPDDARDRFLGMLETGVKSLHALLEDLTALTRLEAGKEHREIAPLEVGQLVGDLCTAMQPLARERGLYLDTESGPELVVDGDAVKIRRILQNLLLNALEHTQRGGIKLTWSTAESSDQWVICVQDTGPGLGGQAKGSLASALKDATDEAGAVETMNANTVSEVVDAAPAATLPSESNASASRSISGEGIGLSIVKRLCELLDASIELHTGPGEGTTFRLRFPIRYTA